MSQNLVQLILSIFGLTLIYKWIKQQYIEFINLPKNNRFFSLSRFKNIALVFLLVSVPYVIINTTHLASICHFDATRYKSNKNYYAIIVSFIISLGWFLYLLKLDIYNKEKKRHLFLIFVLAITFTSFAFLPYEFIHRIGFRDSPNPFYSFIYSVFGIGLIEETIKMIPLLILIKFTKAVDEPYDFILYASVSALGFSFVENSMYLSNYGLDIINARAIYATLAHMTFSSFIAYGLFLNHFKKTKYPPKLVFISFFLLAITAHGFYDFWIMNQRVVAFNGLTSIFLLIIIHVWFVLINNTINTSNYFNHTIQLKNDALKVYLVFLLLGLSMLSYIFVSFIWGVEKANIFLWDSLIVYGYVIFYIVGTLSKYNIVEGLLRPLRLSFRIFNPKTK
jgi:RsiW-degrading membrane proteinase PrsW (M82 family)